MKGVRQHYNSRPDIARTFGLGRHATTTRNQDRLPNYKEVRGFSILAEAQVWVCVRGESVIDFYYVFINVCVWLKKFVNTR